jgi:release factor glutamine methyltransferase
MRRLYRYFWLPFYRLWALRFIRREQPFRYGRLRLRVPPEVFHPGVFFSTPIFLSFLQKIDFQGKKTLDLGTGSGILGLFAAEQGAIAFALDINPKAVETARQNALANNLSLQIWQSDLFEQVPATCFEIVLINPPYYAQTPTSQAEQAFFAGANLAYFEKLFRQLPGFIDLKSVVWMILSEDCALEEIQQIATRNKLTFATAFEKRKWGERFLIFEVRLEKF